MVSPTFRALSAKKQAIKVQAVAFSPLDWAPAPGPPAERLAGRDHNPGPDPHQRHHPHRIWALPVGPVALRRGRRPGLGTATLLGLVPAKAMFWGFGHPATVTVALVLILSRGLQNAGATDIVAKYLLPPLKRPEAHIGALGAVAAGLSAASLYNSKGCRDYPNQGTTWGTAPPPLGSQDSLFPIRKHRRSCSPSGRGGYASGRDSGHRSKGVTNPNTRRPHPPPF